VAWPPHFWPRGGWSHPHGQSGVVEPPPWPRGWSGHPQKPKKKKKKKKRLGLGLLGVAGPPPRAWGWIWPPHFWPRGWLEPPPPPPPGLGVDSTNPYGRSEDPMAKGVVRPPPKAQKKKKKKKPRMGFGLLGVAGPPPRAWGWIRPPHFWPRGWLEPPPPPPLFFFFNIFLFLFFFKKSFNGKMVKTTSF
jgi:hypothetical protein